MALIAPACTRIFGEAVARPEHGAKGRPLRLKCLHENLRFKLILGIFRGFSSKLPQNRHPERMTILWELDEKTS
jgi:hypothetical protein